MNQDIAVKAVIGCSQFVEFVDMEVIGKRLIESGKIADHDFRRDLLAILLFADDAEVREGRKSIGLVSMTKENTSLVIECLLYFYDVWVDFSGPIALDGTCFIDLVSDLFSRNILLKDEFRQISSLTSEEKNIAKGLFIENLILGGGTRYRDGMVLCNSNANAAWLGENYEFVRTRKQYMVDHQTVEKDDLIRTQGITPPLVDGAL